MAEEKQCSWCKEVKPLSDFHNDKARKDGKKGVCKQCVLNRYMERQKEYLKEHPNINSKLCPKCKSELPIENFSKSKYSLDGHASYCKKCSIISSTVYLKKHPEKSRAANARWRAKNYEYDVARSTEWNRKHPERVNRNVQKALKRKAKFKTYASQLTTDEKPIEDAKGHIKVVCTYCGRSFHPTVQEVTRRIEALHGRQAGESRMYCSDNCKSACPTFNQHLFPKGFRPATSREAQPVLRQFVLERDKYTCQICFKSIPDVELHCHHILGYKQHRAYAEDPDNCVSLCKKCHKKVHKLPGCNYKDLRCKEPTTNAKV